MSEESLHRNATILYKCRHFSLSVTLRNICNVYAVRWISSLLQSLVRCDITLPDVSDENILWYNDMRHAVSNLAPIVP